MCFSIARTMYQICNNIYLQIYRKLNRKRQNISTVFILFSSVFLLCECDSLLPKNIWIQGVANLLTREFVCSDRKQLLCIVGAEENREYLKHHIYLIA
jgi:hypothetical protein